MPRARLSASFAAVLGPEHPQGLAEADEGSGLLMIHVHFDASSSSTLPRCERRRQITMRTQNYCGDILFPARWVPRRLPEQTQALCPAARMPARRTLL